MQASMDSVRSAIWQCKCFPWRTEHLVKAELSYISACSVDIPLSATAKTIDESSGRTLLSYIPPHPEKGTPYHRYTYVLLEQSKALPGEIRLPEDQVLDFDTRHFAKQNSLTAAGVTFFRQVWHKSVSSIFKDILSESGRPFMLRFLLRTD